MTTKYYVDQDGRYLGGFDGFVPHEVVTAIEIETRIEAITNARGDAILDDKEKPMTREVKIEHEVEVGVRALDKVYPPIPAGAIEVAGPPPHGWDTWDGKQWVAHRGEPPQQKGE